MHHVKVFISSFDLCSVLYKGCIMGEKGKNRMDEYMSGYERVLVAL